MEDLSRHAHCVTEVLDRTSLGKTTCTTSPTVYQPDPWFIPGDPYWQEPLFL